MTRTTPAPPVLDRTGSKAILGLEAAMVKYETRSARLLGRNLSFDLDLGCRKNMDLLCRPASGAGVRVKRQGRFARETMTPSDTLDMATKVVAAFVANNSVPTSELPSLIGAIH